MTHSHLYPKNINSQNTLLNTNYKHSLHFQHLEIIFSSYVSLIHFMIQDQNLSFRDNSLMSKVGRLWIFPLKSIIHTYRTSKPKEQHHITSFYQCSLEVSTLGETSKVSISGNKKETQNKTCYHLKLYQSE